MMHSGMSYPSALKVAHVDVDRVEAIGKREPRDWRHDFLQLLDRMKRLETALQFYAGEKNYKTGRDPETGKRRPALVTLDQGNIAREALE